MKKIIAAAVATAFVAPAFAADVSVSGEVEQTFTNGDSANKTSSGSEFTISASDELANGLSVSAYVHVDGGAFDDFLSVSGSFGSISIGSDGDTALSAYEDKADVASAGAANGAAGTGAGGTPVLIEPNLGINGLTLGIGYRAGGTEGDEATDFAIAYEAMGLELTYAQSDLESSEHTTTVTSVAYSFGPLYVALDSVENNEGVENNDAEAVGVTYDIGAATLFYEQNEVGTNDAEVTSFGAEYQVGTGLEVYVANIDADGQASDQTVIGAEYKF